MSSCCETPMYKGIEKRKLTIKEESDFIEVTKDSLDKLVDEDVKKNNLSMRTNILEDRTTIEVLLVSPDKNSIDNFVGYLVDAYGAVMNDD